MKHNFKLQMVYLSVIIGIIILFGIIRIAMPNHEYQYDTGGYISEGTEKSIVCDNIALPMGVYQVRLDYEEIDEDAQAFIGVEDGSVYTGGLLCTGDVFWQGSANTECTVWLFERTENVSVYIQTNLNECPFQYGRLVIEETDYLWTMLIFNLVCLWLVGAAVLYLINAIRTGKLTKERKFEIPGLGLLSVIGSVLFMSGYLPSGADTGYHLERVESVAYSIRDGVFPIRLEAFYPFGYGYANGLFYCDLSLYIPGFLRFLGFPVQSAYNIFGIVCVVAGNITSYYCFKRIFKNSYIGMLGAVLNNLAMYHVFDTVIRGGTGYIVASVLFTVLLYGYYRLFSEDNRLPEYKSVWIPISIGYTGIICSHMLSLEISALWTVIVLLTVIPKVFRKNTLLELLKALGAVIVFNAWFIIPFIDYYLSENVVIKNVAARQIQMMGLSCTNYFRRPFDIAFVDEGAYLTSQLQLFNTIIVILVVTFIVLWICGVWKRFKGNAFMNMAKICSVYSVICFVLSLRAFPWDFLHGLNPIFEKIISVIQFPYRFLGYEDLFASVTVCALVWGLWQYKSNILKYSVTAIVMASVLIYSGYFIECAEMNGMSALKMYDMTMQREYLSGGEYAVYGLNFKDIRPWLEAKSSENVDVTEYEKGDLKADLTVINNSDSEGYVEVPLLHYKGYVALDENGNELVCDKGTEYVVRANIPQGYSGIVSIFFRSPWYWRVAEVISYMSWALFIACNIIRKRRAK